MVLLFIHIEAHSSAHILLQYPTLENNDILFTISMEWQLISRTNLINSRAEGENSTKKTDEW
jgi:hypothetical protein